jgi:hypothetical protein
LSSNPGVARSQSERIDDVPTLDSLLVGILRGDFGATGVLGYVDPVALGRAAVHHGVLPMISERLATLSDVPTALRQHFGTESSRHAAMDLLREPELHTLVTEISAPPISALLMKGAQLAYSHYPRPDLRPRLDTDLLIPERAAPATRAVLSRLGYEPAGHVSGRFVMSQECYVKRSGRLPIHAVDVHWRIANPQVFTGVLSYQELSSSAVSVPQLGPAARGLSDVHALLVACVHRVAHHFDSNRLIWLYDIHLLSSRLGDTDWSAFVRLAVDRRVASVCRQSLLRTTGAFGSAVPADVLAALAEASERDAEPTARYLASSSTGRHQVDVLVGDLRALRTWADRWQLVKEHVFPPARYMRDVYAPSSRAPLSLLYARRALLGARKWLIRD